MDDLILEDYDVYLVENPWKAYVFVELHTNQGHTGLAEATAWGKPQTVATAVEELSDHFLGMNPFNTEALSLEIYRDEWYSDNIVNTTVAAAVDTACWDIKGKVLNRPVYELLGGSVHGDRIPIYTNGWYIDADGDPEALADAAISVVENGYDAMKFDPFGDAWHRLRNRDKEAAIERVAAVREAVGSDVDLLIEGHGRFTPAVAVDIARRLEPFNPYCFEEPTPPDNIHGLRKVSQQSPVPIASGERLMSVFAFDELLSETEVDIVQPDLANAGGLTEAKKIAALAEAKHVDFAPHNPQGPVGTALSAQVSATLPNLAMQESVDDYDTPWRDEILRDPLVIEDGYLKLPDRPGIGVELNHDVVKEKAYDKAVSHSVNLFEHKWEDTVYD
ncbi:mandelate racemase/muconate lactonizing enzyme family protein [Natrialbaceae archaeon A-CW3]